MSCHKQNNKKVYKVLWHKGSSLTIVSNNGNKNNNR